MTNSQQSEKEAVFTRLDSLLRSEEFWKADYTTSRLMFLTAGTTALKWLEIEDIENFPCEDLSRINELWLHYSGGKFGFSIQKEIYHSLGGMKEDNQEVWEKFSDLVGWPINKKFFHHNELTFNLNAPQGHLPVAINCACFQYACGIIFSWERLDGSNLVSDFAQRLEACKI